MPFTEGDFALARTVEAGRAFTQVQQWFEHDCDPSAWLTTRSHILTFTDFLSTYTRKDAIRVTLDALRNQAQAEIPELTSLREAWNQLVAFVESHNPPHSQPLPAT